MCLPRIMFLKLPALWPSNKDFQIKRSGLKSPDQRVLLACHIDTGPLKTG